MLHKWLAEHFDNFHDNAFKVGKSIFVMRLKTFCSLTIIPTLILILLLISSLDNYSPNTQVYSQIQNDTEVQMNYMKQLSNESNAVLNSNTIANTSGK